MNTLACILSAIPFVLIFTFFIRPYVPALYLLIPKVVAQNISLYLVLLGLAGLVLGWVHGSYFAIVMGAIAALVFGVYFIRCTRGHKQFAAVFGEDWLSKIKPEQLKLMPQKRWSWYRHETLPAGAKWERDIPFWNIPGREQALLCDLWLPAEETRTGLAVVYLHGSAWALGSKDMGTRPFFRHLVRQGHTVMDVDYRLCPEVDIFGMVGDGQRAVAWLKTNASKYSIDPDKIVLAGGSAGGHVALMAAYTPNHPKFTPDDIGDTETSVCGMVSIYGTIDLAAGYKIYRVEPLAKKIPKVPVGTKVNPRNISEAGRYGGRPDIFLGGTPDEVPEMYELANPGTHINANTPPTFLAQGLSDFLTPPDITQAFYEKLRQTGVPAIYVTSPWTEHAFDLFIPQTSPFTHSVWYDLDRFLGILANPNSSH